VQSNTDVPTVITLNRRLQPTVETAEARVLTSAAGAALHRPPVQVSRPILEGSFTARYTVNLNLSQILSLGPITEHLSGSGRVSPLGSVRVSGTMDGSISVNNTQMTASNPGQITLAGPHGRVTLKLLAFPTAVPTQTLPFSIVGGTGAYKNSSGDGLLQLTHTGGVSTAHSSHGEVFSTSAEFQFVQ
jgi:hypothetical protein